MSGFSRPALPLIAILLVLAGSARAAAQEYVVAVAEENFRARPNGAKLGTLRRGTPLDALEARGRWIQASLRGWIWTRSVEAAGARGSLRVRIASENLRASPSAKARLLGTVLRGTRMKRLGTRGGWTRVEYDGWVWQPSLTGNAAAAGDADEGTDAPAASSDATDAPAGVSARTVSAAKENLRSGPNGARRGTLQRGADLTVLGRSGSWLNVETRGWFWAGSARGSGAQRTVAPAVENLRVAPGAAIQGVLTRGAPLQVVGSAGRWLEVAVRGWIWEPSTRALEPAQPAAPAPAREAAPPGAPAAEASAEPAATPSRTLSRSIPLKDGPDGELVAQALAGGRIVPLRTQGDWVKVRVEGWVPRDLIEEGAPSRRDGEPVTVAMAAADPEAYRGVEATWKLELIAVEQADERRTDFRPGEHYLLTRNVTGEREYVYVAVSPGVALELRDLAPFTRITVRGRIRTGRSALVGNPILDLQELIEPKR